jgi:hypothetical protein
LGISQSSKLFRRHPMRVSVSVANELFISFIKIANQRLYVSRPDPERKKIAWSDVNFNILEFELHAHCYEKYSGYNPGTAVTVVGGGRTHGREN